jgi:hypothetical protein
VPPTRSGITLASTTRSRSTPNTRSSPSTTAAASSAVPILQVPSGWWTLMPVARICASMSGSEVLSVPGAISPAMNGRSGACFATSRASRKPARKVAQSLSHDHGSGAGLGVAADVVRSTTDNVDRAAAATSLQTTALRSSRRVAFRHSGGLSGARVLTTTNAGRNHGAGPAADSERRLRVRASVLRWDAQQWAMAQTMPSLAAPSFESSNATCLKLGCVSETPATIACND